LSWKFDLTWKFASSWKCDLGWKWNLSWKWMILASYRLIFYLDKKDEIYHYSSKEHPKN
jgi:hypothetical protein